MTDVYEAMPDGEALVTVTFAENDGRTVLTLLMQLASNEARDLVLSSGMEAGTQQSWDRLEQVAISLQ
jgi:uncharacterized protein YndB with AHSA1/START domain